MHIDDHTPLPKPRLGRPRLRFALALGLALTLSLGLAACTDDDDDDNATPTATADTAAVATATPEPAAAGGTLTPAETPTPMPATPPAATPAAGEADEDPGVVQIVDLVPCGDAAYYDVQVTNGDVPVLTYVNVPEGTPILFPFERGRLRLADARAGGIALVYDVQGVGVFTVYAAGSGSLDRNVTHPVEGTVLGQFGGTFGEWESPGFEGYQLFAVTGSRELVQVGDMLFAGEPLQPSITDCIVLP